MKNFQFTMILLLTLCLLQACAVKNPDALISELRSAGFPVTYINDGAGDESVLNTLHYSDGQNRKCDKTLTGVLALGEKAIPMMIAHLDDRSPTKARYQEDETLSVPFGFVCLDILIEVTDSPAIIRDCAEDGMGACVRPKYYFMPDAPASEAGIVKENWQSLYQNGEIKFVYPEWWRKRP